MREESERQRKGFYCGWGIERECRLYNFSWGEGNAAGRRTAEYFDLRLFGPDARSFDARRLRAQFGVPDLAQLRVVFALAVAFDDCDGFRCDCFTLRVSRRDFRLA